MYVCMYVCMYVSTPLIIHPSIPPSRVMLVQLSSSFACACLCVYPPPKRAVLLLPLPLLLLLLLWLLRDFLALHGCSGRHGRRGAELTFFHAALIADPAVRASVRFVRACVSVCLCARATVRAHKRVRLPRSLRIPATKITYFGKTWEHIR